MDSIKGEQENEVNWKVYMKMEYNPWPYEIRCASLVQNAFARGCILFTMILLVKFIYFSLVSHLLVYVFMDRTSDRYSMFIYSHLWTNVSGYVLNNSCLFPSVP